MEASTNEIRMTKIWRLNQRKISITWQNGILDFDQQSPILTNKIEILASKKKHFRQLKWDLIIKIRYESTKLGVLNGNLAGDKSKFNWGFYIWARYESLTHKSHRVSGMTCED